jgi:Tol biopolymer transport system component
MWKATIVLGVASVALAGIALSADAPNAATLRLVRAAEQTCSGGHDQVHRRSFELKIDGKQYADRSIKAGAWIRTSGGGSEPQGGADLCLKDHNTWCRLGADTVIRFRPPKNKGILLRVSRGKPSCSMRGTTVQLKRDNAGSYLIRPRPTSSSTTAAVVSERTPSASSASGDPVFSVGVGNAPSVVKVQRGVAVVAGPTSLKHAVVLGRNQQVAVAKRNNPSAPRPISLNTSERKVFAQLQTALPKDTDKTAPAVKVVAGPPDPSSLRSATFKFAPAQGVTFTCSLDKAQFQLCPSPFHIPRASPGRHTLAVKGTDPSGNTSEAARYSWTIDGSRILFTSDRTGNRQIWIMDPDGANQEQLTHDSAEDDDPEWSPSRKQIVFHSNRDGNFEIYVMNADGSGVQRLTDDPAIDRNPTWSPDGAQIAFESYRANGNRDIWAMNADGSNQRRLTEDPGEDLDPAWSPDGKRIAFSSTRSGDYELYTMNPDGSDQALLTSGSREFNPSWSPDGTRIVYHALASDGYANIFVVSAGGGAPQQLTNTEQNDYNPAWAPDGHEIVFHSTREHPPVSQIYVMSEDGSDQMRLTSAGGNIVPHW